MYIEEKWLNLHECSSLKLHEMMNLEYFISNTNQWYAQENDFDPRKNFLLESSVCRHAFYSRTRLQWVQLIQNLKSEPGGMKFQMKNSHGFINGYIDVGDGCSRPTVLVTSLGCWWQVMSPKIQDSDLISEKFHVFGITKKFVLFELNYSQLIVTNSELS